jgi:hypothetical protein
MIVSIRPASPPSSALWLGHRPLLVAPSWHPPLAPFLCVFETHLNLPKEQLPCKVNVTQAPSPSSLVWWLGGGDIEHGGEGSWMEGKAQNSTTSAQLSV